MIFRASELAFEYPFTISNGRTKTHQPAVVVGLQLGPFMGWGEAPAIAYYGVTVENMMATLAAKQKLIAKFAFTTPDRYWHYLHHLLPQDPFLVSALDMAAWDLFGQMRQQPLYQLFGTQWTPALPLCDYTIGIDSIPVMLEKMKAKPWPIYKIKLGTPDDIAIVKALRAQTDAIIRVDANAGWTLEQALQLIPALAELGVEFVEQPLAKDNWEDMKTLYAQSTLPLLADESCVFEADVARCVGHFHGINIKLTKCSGITPALRMVSNARQLGLKVMMGSMNESTLGSAAIGHFLPQLDYVDMDGPLLLKEDLARGVQFDKGRIALSGKPGLGIEML